MVIDSGGSVGIVGIQPSLEQLVEAFARVGTADFERDNGGVLRVSSVWVSGTSLHGTAERMRVVGGMELVGRVEIDGSRFAVRFMVERAQYDSAQVARVQMRAIEGHFESDVEFVHPSKPIRGRARLIAVHCHDVKDGETVIAAVEGLSGTGVIVSTHQPLRRYDVLELRARFGGELLDGEVQVVDLTPPSADKPSTVECRFCDGKRGRIGQVSRIFEEYDEQRESVGVTDFEGMRRALLGDVEAPEPKRKSLFRRRSR